MKEKEKRMTDFIRIFDGVGTESFCNKVLDHFKKVQTINRVDVIGSPMTMDNKVYFLQNEKDSTLLSFNGELMDEFTKAISPPFEIYKKENTILQEGLEQYALNTDIKLQRTIPGEGYHAWHCESSGLSTARRVLLVFMYLNNCEEGGETEFLYQHKRIEPKRGRLVFAPAYWTHIHRGNPPLKGEKFMINGWIEFVK